MLTIKTGRRDKAGSQEQESVVFKQVTPAILAAAVIAGIFTAATGASSKLDASPIAEPARSVLKACTQQAWPYLNCVGTAVGEPNVRVIKVN